MSETTLGEAIEIFLGRYKSVPATYKTYRRDLQSLLSYVSGELSLTELDGFDLERAVQRYESRETVQSPHTVNKMIKTVRTFFNWCVKLDLIDKSPAKSVQYRAIPQDGAREKAMPIELYRRMVIYYDNLAELQPARWIRALALVLFLDTSARRGGAAGLKWSDIDFDNQKAVIVEKGAKARNVYLGKKLLHTLRQWQLIQKNTQGDYVFSKNGEPVSGPALAQYFRRRCIDAGIGSWGPHSVRHMKGHQLEAQRIPDHTAANLMGHSVETFRTHYVRKGDEEVRKVALENAYDDAQFRTSSRIKKRSIR